MPPESSPPEPARNGNGNDVNRAPLLGSWRRWYAVVLVTMGVLVALFAWLSAHYR